MRGTGYAISEILWWMLVAGLIGIIIGWLLSRVFGGGRRAKELEVELSDQKDRYARISSELGDWKSKSEKLESDLDAKSTELTAANSAIGDLEGKLAGVRTELDASTSKAGSLESNINDLKGELDATLSRASSLEAKVAELPAKDAEIERLSGEVAGIAGLQSTIGERDGRLADLEGQIAAKAAELAELSATHASCGPAAEEGSTRIASLEARLAATDSELSELRTEHAGCGISADETAGRLAGLEVSLSERDSKIAELEGQLATAAAAADTSELEARLANAESKAAGIAERDARIGDLESRLAAAEANSGDVAQRDGRIAELEARLAAAEPRADELVARDARIAELESELAERAAIAPIATPGESSDFEALTASEAEDSLGAPARTKFGTAGADHSDDLKVISGIGPKMEELLNGFGIQSWEQLADFSESDIDKVDAALTEFPGRIRRDEWVPQAQAIIASGHEPVAPDSSSDWASGTTSLGTPGSSHRDDLKVINGIGPKLEATLNGLGIQSWEQLAALDADQLVKVDDALEEFPGRITRDAWVEQAADLIERFPDRSERPDRDSLLNESPPA